MKHLKQFENKSGSLKENAISDINELIDRLEYLRNFIDEKISDDNDLEFFGKINTIHTDIQLLSGKLNYKK
jgi:hypothetical protein